MNATGTLAALSLAVAAIGMPLPSHAAACAGFDDVDSSNPFCPNVEWLRNRQVTLGCTADRYCPNESVTRLQMAAFMNRLGTALTPLVLHTSATSGALDLGLAPVVCQTDAQSIARFPRRALLDGSFSGRAGTGIDIDVRVVASSDGGASWQGPSAVRSATYVAAAQWSSASDVGALDLDVGTTVRFGLQVTRTGAGSANLTDSRCQLRVSIGSRDGTASPY